MEDAPLVIELPEPITAWLKLPDRAGTVRGEVTSAEVREGNLVWVKVRIPMWQRWSTQVKVGEPSMEGLTPGSMDVWAPAGVVEAEAGNRDSLSELVCEHLQNRI